MLSVLVPTYNQDITALANVVHQELKKLTIPFELIFIDDASFSDKNKKNEQVNKLENCTFNTLNKNLGRSKLRNLLVKKAKYNWLLFLDSDVLPSLSDFIDKYIAEIKKEEFKVIVGGIAYSETHSKNYTEYLRCKFGKKSQEVFSDRRNENPYKYLFTANFLISKEVFSVVNFDEFLVKYGYEDLLFAKKLEENKIEIHHIHNPVYHLGIDENLVFIDKTKKAIQNLAFLLRKKDIDFSDTKISSVYKKLTTVKLIMMLNFFSDFFEKYAIEKSSILCYNLFRVCYLYQILKKL